MKNIIFIAPPAAGKGTISDYLVKNYGYVHLSTGDLLRNEVASGSELGKEIAALISVGKLVSDDLIIRLVEEELVHHLKDKPFILDGFPRTIKQAEKLDEMLADSHITDVVVIDLDVDLDTAIKRALGRVVCSSCKKSYNIYNPELSPKQENICDDCGGRLERRVDDTEETFRERYQTYLASTAPIIEYYAEQHKLVKICATDPLEMIYLNVLHAIGNQVLQRKKEVKND